MSLNKKQINVLTLIFILIIYVEIAMIVWISVLPNVLAGIISLSVISFGMLGLIYSKIWGEIEKEE